MKAMLTSSRAQVIMIWWAWIFMLIYGFTLWGLLGMVTPPKPTLTAAEIAAFYTDNNFSIRLGATIASWTSAFMVPFSAAAAIQLARLEKGVPAWSVLCFAGGILMSLFLVLPPLFWGVAAFTPTRAPEITQVMHELGSLTLVTTDQFYIFQMIAMTYVSLTRTHDENSAFPRWLGYLTLWAALAFEVGAISFMTKTGPFAWNGAIVFWMPFTVFGVWVSVTSYWMLRVIKRQGAHEMSQAPVGAAAYARS